jgi:hypothetical protein
MLVDLISERAVYGVGVSFHENLADWNYEHLVDHVIAGVDDPEALLTTSGRKVLVLGYKQWGRGAKYHDKFSQAVQDRLAMWFRTLPLMAQRHHLSFDNLAIHQLNPRRIFRSDGGYDERYMGREGEYSLYVDGVKQQYATSSYSADRNGWTSIRQMYQDVRDRNAVGF